MSSDLLLDQPARANSCRGLIGDIPSSLRHLMWAGLGITDVSSAAVEL